MSGKKPVIVLTIAILLLSSILCPLAIASDAGIRIEGELRLFDPGPLLTAGRTMVPVRFVIEDPALKGVVYWDSTLGKVAMDCRGKYIEFVIGSKTAKVDGVVKNMDVSPFIYQDRSYVPLRFLAEALGATVSWDGGKKEVNVSFSYKPEVFAYYYYSPWEEYAQNIDLFTDVALRWYNTDAKGNLLYEYRDEYEKVLTHARTHRVRTHAGVALMDKEALNTLLNTPGYRQDLIRQLHAEVKKLGFDGVNIDFECISPTDAEVFTLFLRELKDTLGTDIMVSVAVFARTGQENWPVAYQYGAIGRIADRVVVMAYDYSYPGSAAGPVAPLWWVNDVGAYMMANIPREKILLGLPTYGYDWGPVGKAAAITKPKLSLIQKKYQVVAGFDAKSASPYYQYTDENGGKHNLWLENETSLAAKYDLATANRFGGIAFWRIGNGFDDLYRILGH